MRRYAWLAAAGLAFLWLGGCAYVGDPKPPTLDLPMRVLDLRAAEFGSKILIDFTLPMLTTEGLPLEGVKAIELRAAVGSDVRVLPVPPHEPGAVQFDFPAQDWTGKDVALSVRATGSKGKSADWSNVIVLPVTPPLAIPSGFSASATGDGVRLTWQGAGQHFRIFRSTGEKAPEKLADTEKLEYLDASAEFGTTYHYFAQAMEGELHQSEASQTVDITPVDKFAPAVPNGVSAVAGTDAIELAWERNTESDFAGYNIYRSADGGPSEKIADKITAPTYSDRTISAGKKYSYSITSVDQSGNESTQSTALEVTAQ